MHGAVVVTGATGGIGRAVALRLARNGLQVVGTARDEAKASALRKESEQRGGRYPLRTVLLDVTDETSCKQALEEALDIGGGTLGAVVNNAGVGMGGAIEDISEADARDVLEVNLLGPMRMARLALPMMRRQGGGRIVNVSSLAGRVSMPLMGWYCASKHGLEAASNALRMESARDGVEVVVVRPGSYATDLWNGVFARMDSAGGSTYAACYRLADTARPWVAKLPGPEPVARAVQRALLAPRPRAHYAVGADAHVGLVLDGLSPRPVADLSKRVMFGLRPTRAFQRVTAARPAR
ncbi:Short-chain dehydrogenase [Streptomyces sp. DvalAA-14]|uniref:SDR family oxidoreductase n=1 Tax=unclassified Streptomyces TaxID=2593676 RepID=UPI00081BBC11|nr:SDR family oxidoreductase [Streptomyces sp. DvalAA-14]SCE01980.1 Short-chain dehydrogenase [Streptomyces sp. DvalAA-14]